MVGNLEEVWMNRVDLRWDIAQPEASDTVLEREIWASALELGRSGDV